MQTMLELELPFRILALCLLPIGFAIVLLWAMRNVSPGGYSYSFAAMVGPIAILFALFSTFLAADIWNRVQVCIQSIRQEAGAMQNLRHVAQTQGPKGVAVEESLNRYIEASLGHEWASGDNADSAIVDLTLERLAGTISDPELSLPPHSNAQAAMLASYRDILWARAGRLHAAGSHSDPHKWGAVILLGLLTQIAIALLQFESRKARAAALGVFTAAFVVTMVALAAHESPLADLALISPEPIQRLTQ